MAVTSPSRALLSAHLQATWNRSRRELGARGRVVYALVVGLLLLLGALPLLGFSLAGGYFLGRELTLAHARILGGTLGGISLLGGFVGGISGGSRVLAWEATRVFPLRLRSLFAAELVAGLGDLMPMAFSLAAACLLLGTGIASPRLLPILPLPLAGTVLGLLCMQHLISSLAARVVKRLRTGLMLLAVLGWAALSLMPYLVKHSGGPLLAGRAAPLLRALGRAALASPPLQSLEGVRQASLGHWGQALALQIYPMVVLALLLFAVARILAREADPQTLRNAAGTSRERLWTFKTPAMGVGRLHWRTLITSHIGKFGFLVPLMVIVILKGPGAVAKHSGAWSVPGGFAYLALSGVQMQLNQFGLDGPGIKALLLLPIPARDLLAGKTLGLLAYMGTQTLLLLVIMGLAGTLRPAQVLPALCLSGCLFLYQVGLGHWTSAWIPRPMPRDSLKNHNVSPAVIWLGMAATLAGAIVFGGGWLLLAWLAPGLLLPVMALALGSLYLAYRGLVLPAAAEYLDRRREVLVQALGRSA